jgi:hypothetical protein
MLKRTERQEHLLEFAWAMDEGGSQSFVRIQPITQLC